MEKMELLAEWLKDERWQLRVKAAEFGTDEHRDILVTDLDERVRSNVAKFGNDGHRDILVNDQNDWVRARVAKYGNDHHKNLLKNDESWQVKEALAVLLTPEEEEFEYPEYRGLAE